MKNKLLATLALSGALLLAGCAGTDEAAIKTDANITGNITIVNGQIITLPVGNVTVIIISGNTSGNITW